MLMWFVTLTLGTYSIFQLGSALSLPTLASGLRRELRKLESVADLLRTLEETLHSGLVPEIKLWKQLSQLPQPWSELADRSLQELRAQGSAILPTLQRLRQLALEQHATLKNARARSSQAIAQAGVCIALVPFFGITLYALLPGVNDHPIFWFLVCSLTLFWSAMGGAWLLKISDQARWGGLALPERPWVLISQCAGERLLASIRAGVPPDLAWGGVCDFLGRTSPTLAQAWGFQVWLEPSSAISIFNPSSARTAIESAGVAIRRSLQASLLEGRGCTERIESALDGLRRDLRSLIERELGLLATRGLKPLFIFVAPSLLAQLAAGLYLGWIQTSGSWV